MSRLIVGLAALVVSSAACAPGYMKPSELERKNQGPSACRKSCEDLGLRMTALVLVGDQMPGCVCQPLVTNGAQAAPATPGPTPPAAAPAAPAAPVSPAAPSPAEGHGPPETTAPFSAVTSGYVVIAAAAAARQMQQQQQQRVQQVHPL